MEYNYRPTPLGTNASADILVSLLIAAASFLWLLVFVHLEHVRGVFFTATGQANDDDDTPWSEFDAESGVVHTSDNWTFHPMNATHPETGAIVRKQNYLI